MNKFRIKNIMALLAVVFTVGLFSPVKSFAQSPYYNGGTYINQMIRDRMNARRRAAIYAGRKKTPKKKPARKANRRKARRVSQIENITIPKIKLNADLPKRIEIA